MAHRKEQYDVIQTIRPTWHGLEELKEKIVLGETWLDNWELSPVRLQKHGQDSKWTILECSDVPELEIGQPYNPETFKPIGNTDFLELVRASIAGTEHKIVSVGSVRNRGRVFLSLELNGMEKFKAAGREFSAYLNFGNGHDKSSVLWSSTSNTCTVCDNTYSMNLVQVENKESRDGADDIKMRLRHTKNASLKLPAMANLIDKAIGVQAEFALEMEKLASQSITEKNAENLFAGFIGRNVTEIDKGMSTRGRNTVSRLLELHKHGRGNNGENLADSFQAVTEYYTRESSGGDNKLKQYVSSEFGSGQVNKGDFWKLVRNGEARDKAIVRGETLLAHTGN